MGISRTTGASATTRAGPAGFTLRGVHILDSLGEFGSRSDIRVSDGRITGVGAGLPAGDGPDVDLAGCWLMPGVIDTHVHAATHSHDGWEQLKTPYSYRIAETLAALERTLHAGVTTVRDAGGLDAGVRDAVRAGLADGPRAQISVVPISSTGGHGDGFLSGVGLEIPTDGMVPDYPGRPPHLADGVDEMRRVVRSVLRSGADWIKIMATPGVLGTRPAAPEFATGDGLVAEFTDEELCTAVAEAARRGKGVMAHALGGPAVAACVRAGVRSIEHGLWLTEQDADQMAAAGTTLVPTLGIYARLAAEAAAGALPPEIAGRAAAAARVLGEAVRMARAAGVPIALGTDFAHRDSHGTNLGEITHLVRAGLPLGEALLAATATGADLLGLRGVTGRLTVGARFDAVVLEVDPSDPAIFADPASVTAVFAEGRPVRPHPRGPGPPAGGQQCLPPQPGSDTES